ncbi:LemA family protein [Ramlibacter sp. AN1015]|uniref:LemA family protein n=1 Tax=Ramlibacter sp. AN1015 TaxID=3133428 RepID=UPI0030C09A90
MTAAEWIALAVLAGALVWLVWAFNRLVQSRNRIANAFAQIDVQLKRRHDLIPNLVETARRYLSHESSTLESVIRARGEAVSAVDALRPRPADAPKAQALGAAEQVLSASLGRLLAIAEAYPELKADETMRSLSEELTSTENRVGFARQAYNDEVLAYNDRAGQFPELLVARLFGFHPAAMLQSTQSAAERAAPRVAF